MIRRRHRLLTPADVDDLASWAQTRQCQDCAKALAPERNWARAAQDRWGFCGVAAGSSTQRQGWVLIAPAVALPAWHPLSGQSRTPDAAGVVVMHLGNDASFDTGGDFRLVRLLSQVTAGKLVTRASCLEAIACGVGPTEGAPCGSGTCATPHPTMLMAAGFRQVTDDDDSVSALARKFRLDLQSTVLERALTTVRDVFERSWAPMPPPEPSHRETRLPDTA